MGSDEVFSRRWILAEDELLRMLWRCHTGDNPDVVLIELYATHGESRRARPPERRSRRVTRHCQRVVRDGGHDVR